jgi:histidyl-tRNA synthetase
MSEENRIRFEQNPLRMLDSKDERDRRALTDAPKLVDYLCPDCESHFQELRQYLCALELPFQVDPMLVRGFDYYTKTAFEIVSLELGAQNSIGGGGRYDRLVEDLGGPALPGIGFGIGTERCLIVLEQLGKELAFEDERPVAVVMPLTPAARTVAVRLLRELRAEGIAAEMDYAGRSLKAQMRQADRAGARFAIILGEEEIAQGLAAVKDLREGGDQASVPLVEVTSALQSRIG